ncbi:MAG TPA: hypothetical protein VM223_10995, partial [Planctomycetota bacterium]|nr:hypothetical protein [Planctomycetota bacterium]
MSRKCVVWFATCFMILVAGVSAFANGRGLHKKIYAVPAPGKIRIDGKLDDWDLSGQLFMYVVQETSEMQSTRFAMMYDDDALYLSGIVRDPSPMMNRHDPTVDPEKAWDADVCQIYMCLDPALGYPLGNLGTFNSQSDPRVATMYLWYFTDRKEANLACYRSFSGQPHRPEFGANGVIPRDKFQAAYVKADDGRGFTFEYRIPWQTLGTKALPKPGALVAGVVQFDWSAPDGLKTAGGSAWAYDVMGSPGFPFQSSACWGKFVFSEKGNLPKELVEEGLPPEKPLPLTFTYSIPEDSDVSIVLFDANGMAARTLVAQGARRAGENVERWDGLDNDGKPLPPATYTWKGLYHQPIKTKFILSAHNSGQPPYKTDDNTGGWGADHGNATTVCAVGDQMVLAWSMSESGWGIIGTDLAGKKRWGIKHNAEDIATDGARLFVVGDHGYNGAESVKVFDAKDGRPLNWGAVGATAGKPALDPPDGGDDKTNVAAAVAYAKGTVYASWPARNLVGVYDGQSGDLKAAWPVPEPQRLAPRPDGSVAVISQGEIVALRDGEVSPLISDRIDSPAGIAVDPAGNIYAANRGAMQNISVFSADGAFQKTIGKAGGRPRVGRYDGSGILEPGGIAISKDGRLWVAETLDSPKRHSVWDVKTGELVNEFFGGSSYFGWAYMDPKHPDELYCHNVLWKIDLNKGACVPHSTIWRSTGPNMIHAANPGGYAGHFRVLTAKNGKQFGCGMVDYSNTLYMRDGDVFKPIAGTIRIAGGPYGSGALYEVMRNNPQKYPGGAWLWQDANDDQCVQENELTKSPAGRGEITFNWIDPDLNAWCDDGYIFKPVKFAADGRPVYDFTQKTPIPFRGTNANGTSLWLDNQDDTVYTLAPGGNPGIARWTPDKKLLWGYGGVIQWNQALNLDVISPGKLWGLTMPLGIAGDFTGAATYFGPYHIFTRDGIYVAMVMRDGRTGGLGPDITASETITGQIVKPEGMNRYFLLAGDQDGRVTEILGLDTVKRLDGGKYTLTAEQAKAASDALAAYEQAKAKAQRLEIVRGLAGLAAAKGVGKHIDGSRSFTARAAYDERNLYVAYDVTAPVGLVNEITDPKLIFKGGNLLDIQLAADPAADPERKTPAPGDVRILVTQQRGNTVAVIFRPKVKGFGGQPTVLTSGTGKEPFDVIETTDHVTLDYKPRAGEFTATATIPLDLIGLTLKPGSTVRMDLGYIFGNAPGSQAAVRAYWSNNSFSANVVNDVPNESRLEPKEWGTATV